jgi:hypothetical protein
MMRRVRGLFLAAGLALVLAVGWAGDAAADVIVFNNFGAGNSYNTNTGWTAGLNQSGGQPGFVPSMGFIVGGGLNVALSEIDFAAGLVTGANSIDLALRTDAAGVPGATLESFHFGSLGPFGTNNPPLVATSVLHPLLMAGTQYWLTMSTPTTTTWAAWNLNSIGDTGPVYTLDNGSFFSAGTNTRGAFRVQGVAAAVPESSPLVLAGVAGTLVLLGRLVTLGRVHGRVVHEILG